MGEMEEDYPIIIADVMITGLVVAIAVERELYQSVIIAIIEDMIRGIDMIAEEDMMIEAMIVVDMIVTPLMPGTIFHDLWRLQTTYFLSCFLDVVLLAGDITTTAELLLLHLTLEGVIIEDMLLVSSACIKSYPNK